MGSATAKHVAMAALSVVTVLGLIWVWRHDGSPLAHVEGTVLIDGEPLVGAMVVFVPQSRGERGASYGITDTNGHFELSFGRDKDGALIGKHFVHISSDVLDMDDRCRDHPKLKIPKRYNTLTELRFDVTAGANQADFRLDSRTAASKSNSEIR